LFIINKIRDYVNSILKKEKIKMAFNVDSFRSQMIGDGARPNLFECRIPAPGIPGVIMPTNLGFFARAAQLPGSTVNQVPVMYFGRELKFAGNRIFQDWTVTVINDEGFEIRNAFERWMNALNSHVSNVRNPSGVDPLSYTSQGEVIQYGKNGSRAKEYVFVGMFPVDISPIELDWGANDQIEEFAVTFAYQYWTSDTTEFSPT
jgi:hypothetical protein